MFISYLKITLRKLYREKLYTFINIAGLSLGIACCLILGLFLHSELTYDLHHKNHKRIYRVACSEISAHGIENKMACTSAALGSVLKKEFSDVIDYVRFAIINVPGYPGPGIAFRSDEDTFYWKNLYAVDDNVFDVFTYDIIYGDPETALVDPSSVAVSETFAKKYFGEENPIGKTVSKDQTTFKISLVFADLPDNSHIKTDVMLSYNAPVLKLNPSRLTEELWYRTEGYTYLVLPENYSQDSFKKMTEAFYLKYMKEFGDANNMQMDFWLQPLKEIHYGPDLYLDAPSGNAIYLYGSVVIGLLIMLVACINYMNLATARSLKRGREVGIYKVLGANRSKLILQFMGEPILISLMALFLGMIIVELVLIYTPVNELIGNRQLIDYISRPVLLWWLFGSIISIGVLSGVYPAFYLSSISPIAAITSLKKAKAGQLKMRQILVLSQLIISIGVIAGTLLMFFQIQYVTDKPLGFERENRVVVRLYGADIMEKTKIIKNELLKNPNIQGVTISNSLPGMVVGTGIFSLEKNDGVLESQKLSFLYAHNDDFVDVMGMELIEGRNFIGSVSTGNDETIIVNETLVREMDWNNPLGKKIQIGENTERIIGVVKDFNFQSMHSAVEPFMLVRVDRDYASMDEDTRKMHGGLMVAHISERNVPKTLEYIRNVMEKLDPEHATEFEFLDDILDRLYVSEKQVMGLAGIFSGICVIISCLGLFGLSAFVTEQRSKEIGVRKVLGASSMQLILMLSRPTLILVLIASVIASISAYLVIDEWWLTGFAYRAEINPLIFVMATLLVILVTFITIALQALKTAQANPVEALRYE